jgi:hypothetical protein
VSKKFLSLIHLIAGELPPCPDVGQTFHERVKFLGCAFPVNIGLQPVPECLVQGGAIGARHFARLLDQMGVQIILAK